MTTSGEGDVADQTRAHAGHRRVVLVTGGAAGSGRAVVQELARLGDDVVVLDRGPAPEGMPGQVTTVTGDVRVPADNERAVNTALDRYGRLDVFVGNAGVHDG